MKAVGNRSHLLLVPLGLGGFALAQPVFYLLLSTPEFLVARQNTAIEVWSMTGLLSLGIPLLLALPGWLSWKRLPSVASVYAWFASGIFLAMFAAQLLQVLSISNPWLFIGISVVIGCLGSWPLLFTRWTMLGSVLAGIALIFPLWFLARIPSLSQLDSYAGEPLPRPHPGKQLPNIIFLLLDELPLATLLDENLQIDKKLFPGFARLQSISNWYFNTTSVSDGTVDAVPSMLIGQYPVMENTRSVFEMHPDSLFSYLRKDYGFNVAESVTRLCPSSLCPREGATTSQRTQALLLDLAAVYLHRVAPREWARGLPEITSNWGGFFAARQVFFPRAWQTRPELKKIPDWPAYFRRFIDSLEVRDRPTLNFLHVLYPHGPYSYLPGGENYGLAWYRGAQDGRWEDVEWGLISAKQRHFLQVQHADRLLGELLDRLQDRDMLNDSLLVVVADHGNSFLPNDLHRKLSETNAATMLRVPLFIKLPGQTGPQRIDQPVITIDILPSLLSALGYSWQQVEFDGIDLFSRPLPGLRSRLASSFVQRELRIIDEETLGLQPVVSSNRTHLNLDDADAALWEVGPFDRFRGRRLDSVCQTSQKFATVTRDSFRALLNASENSEIPAFVSGTFIGKHVPPASLPFLITSAEEIVASGHTWVFNGHPRYFALVEPKFVRRPDWSPRAWLLIDGECIGARQTE